MAKNTFHKNKWQEAYDVDRHCGLVPAVPGIYAFFTLNIFTKEKKLVYIGQSQNLAQRLKIYHPLERRVQVEDCIFLCRYLITDEHIEKEKAYIKRFCPIYNVQHNPNIKRKIVYENGQTLY